MAYWLKDYGASGRDFSRDGGSIGGRESREGTNYELAAMLLVSPDTGGCVASGVDVFGQRACGGLDLSSGGEVGQFGGGQRNTELVTGDVCGVGGCQGSVCAGQTVVVPE